MKCLGFVCLLALSGCIELNLGDIPFLCNNGMPECPEGYTCLQVGTGPKRCVKQGATLPKRDVAKLVDGGTIDTSPISDLPTALPDQPLADFPALNPDKKATDVHPQIKDTKVVDGWPPHFGCQSHSECTSPDYPCCCPMPLVPDIWTCLPLCFDPFCI
jgi:hypothetical protein